jgi:hypothetical protein
MGDFMNGKPGDHPLTDILVHKLEVFSPETDELIRGISDCSSRHELYEWWNTEIKDSTDRELVQRKAEVRYAELLQRTRSSGWSAK